MVVTQLDSTRTNGTPHKKLTMSRPEGFLELALDARQDLVVSTSCVGYVSSPEDQDLGHDVELSMNPPSMQRLRTQERVTVCIHAASLTTGLPHPRHFNLLKPFAGVTGVLVKPTTGSVSTLTCPQFAGDVLVLSAQKVPGGLAFIMAINWVTGQLLGVIPSVSSSQTRCKRVSKLTFR
jgi:hypothetical protein